jgi:hypothetical protein
MTTEPTVPAAPIAPTVQPGLDKLAETTGEKAAALASAAAVAAAIKPTDTSRAAAAAEIAKLKANPEFVKKLHAGGTEESKRWRELHAAVAATATPDEDAAELTKRVATLQAFGLDLTGPAGADLISVLKGAPISVEVRRQVEARRTALMRDPGWSRKYLDGDLECRRQMATIAVLMSAQVQRGAA